MVEVELVSLRDGGFYWFYDDYRCFFESKVYPSEVAALLALVTNMVEWRVVDISDVFRKAEAKKEDVGEV